MNLLTTRRIHYSLMLRPQRNEQVGLGSCVLASLHERPQELASLRKANCIESTLQLGRAPDLFAHGGDLLVHIAKVGRPHIL